MEFGKRMRKKRKALGLTLVELGEKVGYSHAALGAIETGRSNGRRGSLAAIKAFLGMRGGAMGKKAVKAPRKPKAPAPVTDSLAPLLASLDALRASVDRLQDSVDAITGALWDRDVLKGFKPAPSASLVPPVEVQRANTEAMTQGIARNGLRRPLASNSLDPVLGARLMPVAGA